MTTEFKKNILCEFTSAELLKELRARGVRIPEIISESDFFVEWSYQEGKDYYSFYFIRNNVKRPIEDWRIVEDYPDLFPNGIDEFVPEFFCGEYASGNYYESIYNKEETFKRLKELGYGLGS